MRNHYKLVLDTETTNDIDNPLTYDIGFAIVDKEGSVKKTFSFVVSDIFLDHELMESAFFKDKIPQYEQDLKEGTRTLATLNTIRKTLATVCRLYGITEIWAHNARFDYLALQTTQRYLTKSKYRWFFPYGVTMCDTLKTSREILGSDINYIKFCNDNNYITKNGKPRFTAEIITRYLTDNNEFQEVHCGLQDVLIEKDILAYCLKQNPKINGRLWD